MPEVELRGWDATAKVWRKIRINASGQVIIDPSAFLENPPTEDEDKKAPTSEWAYDHKANASAHHVKYTDAEAVASFGNRAAVLTSGNYTNYDLTNISILYLNSTAGGINLYGFAGGSNGKIVLIIKYTGGYNTVVAHDSSSAAAGDKIWSSSRANFFIRGAYEGGIILFYYNNYWNVHMYPFQAPGVFIDANPVDGQNDKAIASNWAYDHKASASAHHARYTDAEAVAAFGGRTATLTTGTYTNYDVSDLNYLKVDTSGGDVIIKGLSGGIEGQRLILLKFDSANDVDVIHLSADAADGDKIVPWSGSDETFAAGHYGYFSMIKRSNWWYVDRALT